MLVLLKFTRLQLPESLFEVHQRPFGFSNLCIVAPEYVRICRCLAQQPGSIQDLSLGLDVLVDLLDLVVELLPLDVKAGEIYAMYCEGTDVLWPSLDKECARAPSKAYMAFRTKPD
jgi:hypothetical protein